MATGNALIGTLRRSLGDVTFYRRDGEQIQRARIRKIANPQSTAQASQRLKLPVVTRFYSAFREPLDRSWENKNRSKSYSAFLKYNIDKFEGPYLLKDEEFVPGPFRVSQGSIMPLSIEPTEDLSKIDFPLDMAAIKAAVGTGGSLNTVKAFTAGMLNYGYMEGDQITVLAVTQIEDTFVPTWTRFILNSNNSDNMTTVLPKGFAVGLSDTSTSYQWQTLTTVAIAIIVSRKRSDGVWLRSTAKMYISSELAEYFSTEALDDSTNSYQKKDSANEPSDVYLNNAGVNKVKTTTGEVVELMSYQGRFYDQSSGKSYMALLGRTTGNDKLGMYAVQNDDSNSDHYKMFLLYNKKPSSTSDAAWGDYDVTTASGFTGIVNASEAIKVLG